MTTILYCHVSCCILFFLWNYSLSLVLALFFRSKEKSGSRATVVNEKQFLLK